MIQGVHHFAIIVSTEASIRFYEVLGFKEFFRKERSYDTIVLLYGHGIQIEAFVDSNHSPRSNPEPLGMRHLAMRVYNIEQTAEKLGLVIGPIRKDWLGIRFAFTSDPDGNVVELHE